LILNCVQYVLMLWCLFFIIIYHFFLLPGLTTVSTLFPYTTLFRSEELGGALHLEVQDLPSRKAVELHLERLARKAQPAAGLAGRSEEHTSELQSRENLVCRLLLEKKKLCNTNNNTQHYIYTFNKLT